MAISFSNKKVVSSKDSSVPSSKDEQSDVRWNNPLETASITFFSLIARLIFAILALFVFLISLAILSQTLRLLSGQEISNIIAATANPFVGLFIGLLTTAIIQKSSITTSLVVAMVAADTLSLSQAVPIVIGANIGTTITAMLVSFTHITKKKEFKRATSTAITHNLFNIFGVLVLFPLEYFTQFLTNISQYVTEQVKPLSSSIFKSGLQGIMDLTVNPVSDFLMTFFNQNVFILLPFAVAFIFISISSFTLIIKPILMGKRWSQLQYFIFGTPTRSLVWGTFLTAALQSSSLTTSITVSLVGSHKVPLKNAFPFIMGANIGTTFTAILASISQSDAALSIAITHLLFNLLGVIVLFPFPFLRNIIVKIAQFLGKQTMKNRIISFIYILFVFFLIPFALIFINEVFFR
jgi:sodium-dependent phosphate cotransporter